MPATSLSLREFRKNYHAELLTVSFPSFKVGHEIEWERNAPLAPKFLEISHSFFTDNLELESIQEVELVKSLLRINEKPLEDVNFANINIEKKMDLSSAVKIPTINLDLSNSLSIKKVINMSYKGVKAKYLDEEFNTLLKNYLQQATQDRRWWRKIKGEMFVEQLFYADKVSISIEKGYEIGVEAALKVAEIEFEVSFDLEGSNTTTISFSNPQKCPFAVKIGDVEDIMM